MIEPDCRQIDDLGAQHPNGGGSGSERAVVYDELSSLNFERKTFYATFVEYRTST